MIFNLLLFSLLGCHTADLGFSATDDDIVMQQGEALMEWSPSTIVISDMEVGITYSGIITITSVGENTLQIDKVDVTDSANGVFYMDTSATEDLSLASGVPREIILIAQIEEANTYTGEVRIRSNFINDTDVRIPVCAFPLGYEGELLCGDESASTDTGSQNTGLEDTGSQDTGN